MSGVELSLGKIVDSSPAFSTVLADVHTGDCGENFSIRSVGIHGNAIGPDVGTCLIFFPMQKKHCMGHSLHRDCVDRIVHSPAGGQMESSDGAHSMNG